MSEGAGVERGKPGHIHRWADRLEAVWYWWRILGRDLVLFVSLGLALMAVTSLQEGRRRAIKINCGISQAIIDAGRNIITGSSGGTSQPSEFEKNLEKLGYPPPEVRKRQAQQAARLYAIQIAKAVERESGVKNLVSPEGNIDCEKILDAGGAG